MDNSILFRRAYLVAMLNKWWKDTKSEPSLGQLAYVVNQSETTTALDVSALRDEGFIEKDRLKVVSEKK